MAGYKWTAMEANCHHGDHIIMFDNHFGYISRLHANLNEIEQIQWKNVQESVTEMVEVNLTLLC